MRKYGGFIPGIRPGKKTADSIDRVLTRITAVGSLYLAAVCVLPEFLITGFHVAQLPFIGARSIARSRRGSRPAWDSSSIRRKHRCSSWSASRWTRFSDRVTARDAPLRRLHEGNAPPRSPRLSVEGNRTVRVILVGPPGAEKGRRRSRYPNASAFRTSRPETSSERPCEPDGARPPGRTNHGCRWARS